MFQVACGLAVSDCLPPFHSPTLPNMHDHHETLQAFVRRSRSLYSLPAVALEVLERTRCPEVDTKALAGCIEKDPALTTKLLKVVNSSLFGLSCPVSDLHQAIALLGTKPLKLLVLGFSLPEPLLMETAGNSLARYWRYALTKAAAARELYQTIWRIDASEAFLAGLLADLGMLVLLQDLGGQYALFVDRAVAEQVDLSQLEIQALGFNHTQLTASLLADWKIPEPLPSVIAAHLVMDRWSRLSAEQTKLAQVLYLADLLAQLIVDQRYDLLPLALSTGREQCQLQRNQLSALVERLDQTVATLAEHLNLKIAGSHDYRDILATAHQQMAEVALEFAGERHPNEGPLLEKVFAETQALAAAAHEIATPHDPTSSVTEPADESLRDRPAAKIVSNGPGATAAKPSPTVVESNRSPKTVLQDPGFAGRLQAALTGCRQSRQEFSLMLLDIDNFDDLLITQGPDGARQIRATIESLATTVLPQTATVWQLRDSRWAILLPGSDRRQAVENANHLLEKLGQPTNLPTPVISVGIAALSLVPKNFPASRLLESGERCLYAAQSGGGNLVKSIEIC